MKNEEKKEHGPDEVEASEAVAVAADCSAWFDFESAPKDGTCFLVHEPFEPATEAAWMADDGELFPCSNRSSFWKKPKYWMPIPLLPKNHC